jgi:hypothetical protein
MARNEVEICLASLVSKLRTRMETGEGTCMGETSRLVYECVGKPSDGVEALRKESHIVKHWFTTHHALEEAPPFKFKLIQ